MKVSVLILTHNESSNLPACLRALAWCDDIVVVDSGSADETVAIANSHGARVLERRFDNFAGQRNFGLDVGMLRHDWVLHLDADEIVTGDFAKALAASEPQPGIHALRVPFKMIFFGRWLRHAAMWPAYQVRLGHVRRLRFIQVGHGQREDLPPSSVGTFPEALLHYSFSHGLKPWLHKHVRYARDEANVIVENRKKRGAFKAALFGNNSTERRRGAKALSSGLPPFIRPLARFVYIYICRGGFLDGKPGFVFAAMLATYEAMTAILVYELTRKDALKTIPPASNAVIGALVPDPTRLTSENLRRSKPCLEGSDPSIAEIAQRSV